MTQGHLGRPPARHPRGADHQRLRLDDGPGQHPARDPRQRRGAPEPRPAGRRRRPRPWRRRGEPRLRAAGERVCRRVRGAAQDRPQRAQPGQEGLPAHVRHDGLHRQLPARGVGRRGRGRRDLRDGLRLPDVGVGHGRLHRPAVGAELRPGRHRPRLHRPRQPVADHPRAAVVRPGVVDRRRRGAVEDAQRRQVRLQRRRQLRERGRPSSPSTGGGGTRSSAARTSRTAARTAPRPTAA